MKPARTIVVPNEFDCCSDCVKKTHRFASDPGCCHGHEKHSFVAWESTLVLISGLDDGLLETSCCKSSRCLGSINIDRFLRLLSLLLLLLLCCSIVKDRFELLKPDGFLAGNLYFR